METILYSAQVAVLAGIISLDNTAVIQSMISQPLVACSLIGFITGHPLAGINMGIAFQLLFSSDLPTGSHLPKDASLVSMCALAAALVYGRKGTVESEGILASAAIMAIAAEPFLTASGKIVRRSNSRLISSVRWRLRENRYRSALFMAQSGLLLFFLRGFLVVLVFSMVGGWLLSKVVELLPGDILKAFHWSFVLLPLIGVAHMIGKIKVGGTERFNTKTALLGVFNMSRKTQ